MKKTFLLIFILFLNLSAQESVPPYHWSWEYLNYLKVAGYLTELDFTNRPLYRDQIAKSLLNIPEEALNTNAQLKKMFRILAEEFKNEIREFQENKKLISQVGEKLLNSDNNISIKYGAFGEILETNENRDFQNKFDFQAHPQYGLKYGNHFTLYGNFKIFRQADQDYIGKEFRNLYAYVEQGYFSYQNNFIRFKLGRDFLQIGPGRTGQLLISDNSRPFDMYHVKVGNSFINFSFFGIQLDKRTITDSLQMRYAPVANRFLNGHRLSLNLKNKYYLGLSEVVIYGGPNANWELGFMNPFTIYYGYNVNGPFITGNQFYDIDWDFYLPYETEFYGEFLIDDLQVDKNKPGDLEPNELGLLVGFNWANFMRLNGSLFNMEYVQVRNRTYNVQVNDWEKYLHRNEVIGYYLGNDFKLLHTGIEKWWLAELNTGLFVKWIRKGEGSVEGEFNTDYLKNTVEEGYKEDFPWGIVEKHWQYGINVFFRPYQLANLSFNVAYNDFDNYQNIEGKKKQEVSFTVSLWLQWNNWKSIQ